MEIRTAAIIPTRGQSRRVFSEWAVHRAKQNGYDKVYLIDYPPAGKEFDLMDRIRVGVNRALADGIDYVSIIEDDDWYSVNYLSTIKPFFNDNEIVGINQTTYYHLFSGGWKVMVHPGRSSMFCTSFRTDLFSKFPTSGAPYHDLSIWKFIQNENISFRLLDKQIALGIKHGSVFGNVGGNGHFMSYPQHDGTMHYLRAYVDEEAFLFYRSVKKEFQESWEKGIKRA